MKKIGIALALVLAVGCMSMTPQDKAVTSVKGYVRLMLSYMGKDYEPYDFGTIEPIYLSDGSDLIGYSIDHRYYSSTPKTPDNLHYGRYYLTPKFRVVHSGGTLSQPEERLDSVGREKLKEAYMEDIRP